MASPNQRPEKRPRADNTSSITTTDDTGPSNRSHITDDAPIGSSSSRVEISPNTPPSNSPLPPSLTQPLPDTEVADEEEESDDPFGFDDSDSTRTASTSSITSSITRYRWENGRRYHAYKDGAYWGPNDEQASEHLDIAHHVFLLTFDNKLHLAPIGENPQRVLDIGTGTGIWAMDFADQYPSAQIIGTDLSPIQPTWVQPNLKFEIDDAEDEWMWQGDSFDYIHVRCMFGCIADWPRFYRQVYKHLKPGGYFEQVEFAPGFRSDDGSLDPKSPYGTWHDIGVECGRAMGRSFETMYEMADMVSNAGFTDIHEQRYKWPIGTWKKNRADKVLGAWVRLHIEEGLENWSMAVLTRFLGWSRERVLLEIALVKQDLKRDDIHGYHEMRVVYGQKPARD